MVGIELARYYTVEYLQGMAREIGVNTPAWLFLEILERREHVERTAAFRVRKEGEHGVI